jgi:hypothetical protein
MTKVRYRIRRPGDKKYDPKNTVKDHVCFVGASNEIRFSKESKGILDFCVIRDGINATTVRFNDIVRLKNLVKRMGYDVTLSKGKWHYVDGARVSKGLDWVFSFKINSARDFRDALAGLTLLRYSYETNVFETALKLEKLFLKNNKDTTISLLDCIALAAAWSGGGKGHSINANSFSSYGTSITRIKKRRKAAGSDYRRSGVHYTFEGVNPILYDFNYQDRKADILDVFSSVGTKREVRPAIHKCIDKAVQLEEEEQLRRRAEQRRWRNFE